MKWLLALSQGLGVACLVATSGCSSVGSSAVRTGPYHLPPRSGAVGIFSTVPPPGSQDLGVVEVHAYNNEGTVETLLPVFAQRVAQLGGNAALIQAVSARFEMVQRLQMESYAYPCGYYTCTGTRWLPVYNEVMVVAMTGHAMNSPGIR
jgi:hypothetical protein